MTMNLIVPYGAVKFVFDDRKTQLQMENFVNTSCPKKIIVGLQYLQIFGLHLWV